LAREFRVQSRPAGAMGKPVGSNGLGVNPLNADADPYGVGSSGPAVPAGSGLTAPASNSRNAVSFSSARTTKRFPSPRCSSAIQIVRPLGSIVEAQPQFQPGLLRLSAII